ncbi:hypothetical protein PHMEG_00010740 [Phytophthora megakarya]|uniref:BED-type domain-containing protein n=1 Tax=Phytophthora megakarya TaxID=4795 RepID=A0A225WFF2_9STRA|nr:hypothetical protein PHMEG_00010740 [Phytophthora megakarya]
MSFSAPNKDVAQALFQQQTTTTWKCKLCCNTFSQPLGKGYTNLVDHLTRKHGRDTAEESFRQVQREGVRACVFVQVDSVERFANGYHFVAVIASIPTPTPSLQKQPLSGRRQFLLTFQLIDPKHVDATKKMVDADAIIDLFDEALDKYEIDISQLCCLVGDNASDNGSVGRKIKIPLIGCASHRLNLAVQTHLATCSKEVEKVAALMRYLRTSKQRTVLRKLECSMPVVKNTTRWSSSYLMIKPYIELVEYLDDTDVELASLLPTPREKIKIKALFEDLKKFQSVNMELQHSNGVQLKDVRILFDKLLETFETEGNCSKHLTTTAKVVTSPSFENGIVKIQSGLECELTALEKRAMTVFERPATKPSMGSNQPNQLSFAQAALQEKQVVSESKYVNFAWIPPTSDDVERLFSQAGRVYTDQRQGMLPSNLELLLFLRSNSSVWDEVAVARVLRNMSESRKRNRQQTLLTEVALLINQSRLICQWGFTLWIMGRNGWKRDLPPHQ